MYRSNEIPLSSLQQAAPANGRALWPRLVRWTVATAKRVYPVAFVLGLLAVALAATIAIRVAVWVPMHLR